MITSDSLLNTIKTANKKEESTRMAIVSSVTDGKVYLQFFGDTEPSRKPYKRIDSYTPTEGDTVVVSKVGNSFIITGKVV